MHLLALLVRPFGYLAFLLAVTALRLAGRLLGECNELGFFASRLAAMLCRYPEVTRRGTQIAWVLWAVALAVSVSPLDPLLTSWDEVVLVAVALGVLWPRIVAGHRAAR